MGVAKELLVTVKQSWLGNAENALKKVEEKVLWRPIGEAGERYVMEPFSRSFHAHICSRIHLQNTPTKSLVVKVHHSIGGLLLRSGN